MMYRLRIRHAKQVVLVCNNKERLLTGESMKNLAILEGGLDRGVSIVADNAGKIECIDFDDKVDQDYPNCTFEEEVDASGMCVVPDLALTNFQLRIKEVLHIEWKRLH